MSGIETTFPNRRVLNIQIQILSGQWETCERFIYCVLFVQSNTSSRLFFVYAEAQPTVRSIRAFVVSPLLQCFRSVGRLFVCLRVPVHCVRMFTFGVLFIEKEELCHTCAWLCCSAFVAFISLAIRASFISWCVRCVPHSNGFMGNNKRKVLSSTALYQAHTHTHNVSLCACCVDAYCWFSWSSIWIYQAYCSRRVQRTRRILTHVHAGLFEFVRIRLFS